MGLGLGLGVDVAVRQDLPSSKERSRAGCWKGFYEGGFMDGNGASFLVMDGAVVKDFGLDVGSRDFDF